MSDKEVLSIIKKYENICSSSRALSSNRGENTVPRTSRKFDLENNHTLSFMNMNDSSTPQKEFKENQPQQRFLKKLDQTEEKLALSERNYVELWRKYEGLREQAIQLENRFRNEEQIHDDQLLVSDNKLIRLERDNQIYAEKLVAKENMMRIMEEKLTRKNQEILKIEQDFHMKINSARNVNPLQELESVLTPREITRFQQESARSTNHLLEGYQRQIQQLTIQMKKFDSLLLGKEKQKQKMASHLQDISLQYVKEIHELKSCLKLKDQETHRIIQKNMQERIKSSDHYEQLLREAKKTAFNDNQQSLIRQAQEMSKLKGIIKEFQESISALQDENKNLSGCIQRNRKEIAEFTVKIQQVDKSNQTLMNSLDKSEEHRKSLSHQVNHLENGLSKEHDKNSQISIQFNEIKSKYNCIVNQTEKLGLKNLVMNDQTQKLKTIIMVLEAELQQARNTQAGINGKLTQNTSILKERINFLEGDLEDTTQQLYAERLEKARAIEELSEVKEEMKKEYELSLQNIAREANLRDNLQASKYDSDYLGYNKETLYLKLKDLERKYEMLTSQVVSVQDMIGIATKIHKRYHV